jgi:ribosome-associated protein
LIPSKTTSTIRICQGKARQEDKTIDTENIVRAAAEAAIEMKATDLTILDVRGLTSFCDWFVLCNGSNSRQMQAISNNILRQFKKNLGLQPMGVEGANSSKWVLIDLGDVIVHVFERDMRGYYDLDGLWIDAPRVAPEDLGIEDVPAETRGYALP